MPWVIPVHLVLQNQQDDFHVSKLNTIIAMVQMVHSFFVPDEPWREDFVRREREREDEEHAYMMI